MLLLILLGFLESNSWGLNHPGSHNLSVQWSMFSTQKWMVTMLLSTGEVRIAYKTCFPLFFPLLSPLSLHTPRAEEGNRLFDYMSVFAHIMARISHLSKVCHNSHPNLLIHLLREMLLPRCRKSIVPCIYKEKVLMFQLVKGTSKKKLIV